MRKLVVLNDGVTVVVILTATAESRPRTVTRERPSVRDERPCRLVEDGEVRIHPLHVLGQSYGAVRIRRRELHVITREPIAQTLEVDAWGQQSLVWKRCGLHRVVGVRLVHLDRNPSQKRFPRPKTH